MPKPKREAPVATFIDRIEGQLKDLFPGQRSLISSFFLSASVPRTPTEDSAPETPSTGEGATPA